MVVFIAEIILWVFFFFKFVNYIYYLNPPSGSHALFHINISVVDSLEGQAGRRTGKVGGQTGLEDRSDCLSGGFTPCRHPRPSSGQEHTVRITNFLNFFYIFFYITYSVWWRTGNVGDRYTRTWGTHLIYRSAVGEHQLCWVTKVHQSSWSRWTRWDYPELLVNLLRAGFFPHTAVAPCPLSSLSLLHGID